jgi:iron complex outermembrane receptor protein
MRFFEQTSIATLAIAILTAGNAHAQTASSPPSVPGQPQGSSASPPQEVPPSAEAPVADPARSGLEDIVVTAQRKEENLQRAPIAVAVVGGDLIKSASVASPAQLTALVPAIQVVNTNGSYSNFYVRGVGNFTGNALTESAIAFNYNGVYIARPSSTVGFFYDLERVEVLKGPQGTLYGRNATGGAINVIPQEPTFELGGYGSVGFGNYQAVNLEAALNVPVSSTIAFRFSGIYNYHTGYMKDGTDDQKDRGGRAQLLIKPTDQFSVLLSADYFHQGGKGAGGTAVDLGVDNRFGVFSPQNDQYYGGIQHVLGGTALKPLPNIQFQNNTYWGASARINYKTDIGTFTVIPAYRSSKLDYTTGNIGFFILQKETFNQTTLEGRYSSPDRLPVRVLLGGYYFRERGNDPYNIINNQYGLVYQLNQQYGTNSTAAFGRITFDLTRNFRLTGGLRYTHERRLYSGSALSLTRICLAGFAQCQGQAIPFANNAALPAFTPIPGSPDGSIVPDFTSFGAFPFQVGQFGHFSATNKAATFNKVTWRAGFDWDITPRNLLYASFETGFKSGGFFVTQDQGTYQPETIKAVTVGSKNRFFDNKLQLNLEGFYWKYRNQQISHLGVDSLGTLIFPTENAGRSTLKGGEVDLLYALTPTTRVNVDIQYLDAKYDQFSYNTPAQGGVPQSGCNITPIATGFTVDCSGRRPPQAPRWTINLGASQTINLSGGGKFVLDARTHYQTNTLTSLEYVPQEFQKGYWRTDLQLTYRDPSDRFSVTGFVNNVSDVTVKGQTFLVTYAATPTAVSTLQPPRTYGARIGYRY